MSGISDDSIALFNRVGEQLRADGSSPGCAVMHRGRRGSALSSVKEPPSAPLCRGAGAGGRPGDVLPRIGTAFQRILDAESSATLERRQLLPVDRQRYRRARTAYAAMARARGAGSEQGGRPPRRASKN
jgi:hypothetical protein